MGTLSTTFLALALCVAAPAAAADAGDSSGDPAAEDARELFSEAAILYQTSDYNGAVSSYTEAYSRSFEIEDEELRGRVQAAILFNLARAHSKAYELDRNAEHLRQEVDLLGKYLEQTADLADELDAEILLDQARRELDRLEVEAQAAAAARAEDERSQQDDGDERGRSGRGFKAAGYTLIGLGLASGTVAVSGAVLARNARTQHIEGPTRDDRSAAESRGALANGLIIGGSISAGVLLGTGIVFALVGRSRAAKVRPSAWVSPHSSGLALEGRF